MAVSVLAVALLAMPVAGAAQRDGAFRRTSLDGSGRATMQTETVPARIARVVVRPGSGGREVWAVGTATARNYGVDSRVGQVVFLRFTPDTGWVVTGPPVDERGKPIETLLGAFALTASGEGWAVGDEGEILHKAAGSNRWVRHRQSRVLTTQSLQSISLAADGTGYAVGFGPTALRLANGAWSVDAVPADMAAQTSELTAVAALPGGEAWTVATGQISGVDSTNLLVYRRLGGAWSRVTTGAAMFDSPPARSADGAGLNRAAEAGAIATDGTTVWVGGKMHPRSASSPEGDPAPGDTSRPFVLRFDIEGADWTSYCPDLYAERTAGVDLTRMCDQPFPTAAYHIASLQIVDGHVFAGGLGLFHFDGKGWFREPNTNGYLISISFSGVRDGWVASSGRSLGAGGLIRSDATTIGHFTAAPRPPAIARWAQPQKEMLMGIAGAPDGSGRAIAVGLVGSGIYNGGSAWDSINPAMFYDLFAVGWPRGGDPWAVGQRGTMLRLSGNEWQVVDGPVTDTLFAIAFRSAGEGIAVGAGGTIVAFDGAGWRDVTPKGLDKDLYTVVALPDGWLAAGRDGTIVEGRPGAWRVRTEARPMLLRAGTPNAPSLYAAAVRGDGSIVIGGQDSALLLRAPGGALTHFPQPVEGTVVALASSGDALLASLSPNAEKFRGERPAAQRGTVMAYRDGRWADVGLSRRVTLLRDEVDTSSFDDPIYALTAAPDGTGWGAGGSPADLKDETEGHFRSVATSAIYRVDLDGDPVQPASRTTLTTSAAGVPFAVFGETWCGKGFCTASMGTGVMADMVALQIRDEINQAAALPNGPRFVLFTGNMRRYGVPEELQQFRKFLDGFTIPVYAAPGNLDLFGGIDTGLSVGVSASSGTNDYWKSVFADMPAPWGEGAAPPGIAPVPPLPTEVVQPGLARTHYAFDVVEGGRKVLRVAVVDSSTRSYGQPADQNPQSNQGDWLKAVLTEAADLLNIPSIVMMNQPTVLPSEAQIPNWTLQPQDKEDFESTVTLRRVSAVITGGVRMNARDTLKATVPLLIAGGGGAPLGRDSSVESGATLAPPTKLPTDGYYHGWTLATLDPDVGKRNLLGLSPVDTQTFPTIESIALHSYRGQTLPAGQTTNVTAFARGLSGGFSDPEQAKASTMSYGNTLIERCVNRGQGYGNCLSLQAMQPGVRFYSEQPDIADFVSRSPLNNDAPRRDQGKIVFDPTGSEGLLCAFKPGIANINVVSGFYRSRVSLRVTGGEGTCIDGKIIEPPPPPPPVIDPIPQPQPVKKPEFFFRALNAPETAVVIPPPPAPVIAPAPPGAPGVGRKEEHEVQTETEGHGENEFTAVRMPRRQRALDPVEQSWPLLGAVTLAALLAATATSAVRRRETIPRGAKERVR